MSLGINSNITTFDVNQYANMLQLKLQQNESRLRGAVMSGSHFGAQASPVEQFGPINANKVEGRYQPMVQTDAPTDRRWVFPQDYDLNQLFDTFDKLRLLIDPTSGMSDNAQRALKRAIDTEILNGLMLTNYTGNAGTSSETMTTGQSVPVQQGAASSTNYTVAKMRQARLILQQNEVDFDADQIFSAINATNHDTLLSEMQVVSTEFNDKPVLVEGKVVRFLGIDLIHTELVFTGTDDQSTTSTACPVWAKSGCYLGLWSDIMIKASERNDLRSVPYQVYVKGTFGATRLELKKVVRLWAH